MKVAVSALGSTLDAMVDQRFGRAQYFIIGNTGSTAFEVVDNAVNKGATGGAGIGAAELMSDHKVEAVVTGHLGPNAFNALKAAGIPGYEGSGRTVKDALAALEAGELRELTEAGEAHAG
ncbi:MAG TPA: hypothetical protein ENN10_02880 [Actinobacteria bacterium]|nr:hypothetical protein [Actinomycetota bacterium]